VSAAALGADWPQFRGPHGGSSTEKGLPTTWSAASNIRWKTPLAGFGASSPIVVGNRIILNSYSGYGESQTEPGEQANLELHVSCYARDTGEQLWDYEFAAREPEENYQQFVALHGYASGTPASDGQAVYSFFGKSGVVAVDLEGRELWRADVGDKTHPFGTSNSPLLYKNLVIINASVESGSLVALDKRTGAEVWRALDIDDAWNTPCLVTLADGRQEAALSVHGKMLGFDPASGEKLWTCDTIDDYICPSVIAHGDVLYAVGARKGTAVAVRAGGRGDVTETHRLWKLNKGSNVSSPVYHNGYLYWAQESRGFVYCADAQTGKLVYEQRLQPASDRIYASPLAADGKLYYVSRERGTYVLALRPEFQLLAHNVIADDSSVFNASPVPTRGELLLRSDKFLYCLGDQN
jgi:outer membrane protein assembly factor BamB